MINHFETGEKIDFLFFWGHTGSSINKVSRQCLSQWYEAGFSFDSVYYKTAEHWMMAQKAKLFNELNLFDEIIDSESPQTVKELGRKVKNFGSDVWNEHKCKIVVNGNVHKFTQNPRLFDFLKSTKGKYLIEASPYDPIWGIGISEDNDDIDNPYFWKGENLLGFALMEVRDFLERIDYLRPLVEPMEPPWKVYPNIENGDLFWRMGVGEEYLDRFFHWYNELSITEKEIYKITFPQEAGWSIYS